MEHFIVYKDVQDIITDAYKNKGRPVQSAQVAGSLNPLDYPTQKRPLRVRHMLWCNLSDEEFEQVLLESYVTLNEEEDYSRYYQKKQSFDENIIFQSYNFQGNIMVARHFNYAVEWMHTNGYFELFYVFKGIGKVTLKSETLQLCPGDLCIIPPRLEHALEVDQDDAFMLDIAIRSSNFEKVFFSQLAQDNILSIFFRAAIYDKKVPDYLLFSTKESNDIKILIKNLAMECYLSESKNDFSSTSAANLLFSFLLRNFRTKIKLTNKNCGTDVSLILQYMQINCSSITLEQTATFFNYSKQYLCKVIKQNTGHTFSELIHIQRLNRAIDLLKNTRYSIEQIAEITGYASADHFSRTFKIHYQCSPSVYRKNLKNELPQ